MEENASGFLVPSVSDACINCNRCVKACPSLNPFFGNAVKPDFYSLQANDDVRAVSSSGGMFTLMVDEVLSRGGLVAGASFDENLKLSHSLTDDRDQIKRMRGSKYVQSAIGNSFKEVKKALNEGRWVLFTGTPCQAAGLKSFLGWEEGVDISSLPNNGYEKLVTVDFICHGTPNQRALDAYVKEMAKGRRAVNVEFRSKRFGWTWSHILTTYDDGTEYVGDKTDPYKRGFSRRLLWRESCEQCKFAKFPRQGDITMGDLWGSRVLDPESMDKKGTSLVFINNARGQALFDAIRSNAKYCKKLEVEDYDSIPNRVNTVGDKSHPNRVRALSMLGDYPFSRAMFESLDDHYDVAVPTGLYNLNLGGVLTYYMLFHALKDMGYTVLNLVAPKTASRKPWPAAVEFCEQHLPAYAQPKRFDSVEQMRELNRHVDMFAIGADQYLSESMSKEFDKIWYLNFADPGRPLVAISTSFGGRPLAKRSKQYVDELKYYLNRFTAFSCREDFGVNFANRDLQLTPRAKWVIDPIFLASPKYLEELVPETENHEPFVGAYIILDDEKKWDLIDTVRNMKGGIPLRVFGRANAKEIKDAEYLKRIGVTPEPSFPVENSLWIIKNCDYFVTDSFHGLCLAIIFKREFVVMPRDFPDRFRSILRRLSLEDRLIPIDAPEFDIEALAPIDWDSVYEKLEPLRQDGLEFIKSSLRPDAIRLQANDIVALENELVKYGRQVKSLEKQVKSLEKQVKSQEKQMKSLEKRVAQVERMKDKLKATIVYKGYAAVKKSWAGLTTKE